MTQSPAYRVQLFSEPLLEGPDGNCHLSPYQSALLTVVFGQRSISRDEVSQLLWQGEGRTKTRPRLRQLKNEIRRRAGVQVLEADRDLLIAGSKIECDVEEVGELIARGRLSEAAEMVGRGLACRNRLKGISDALEDWSEHFVHQLSSQIAAQARARWAARSTKADWMAARDAAEALYALEPNSADAVARVIEARARIGRLQAAEVAYAEFTEGQSASTDAPSVEEAILRVRSLADDQGVARPAPEVPFIGRQEAISKLTAAFAEVRDGTFSFSLVVGEAGIGKTRLIREVERAAGMEGLRCLAAEPVELERRISMNPIIDALSAVELEPHLDAIGDPWRTVIGTMLPPGPHAEPVQALPPIDDKSLSRRLLDAFSLLLQSIGDQQPTIFFLDDIHWADATTIAALEFFRRRWRRSYFGVVATVRPTMVGNKDPVQPYLTDEQPGVRLLHLEELSELEARHLVESISQEEIDASAVGKLCALSGRHPLYLTELTRDYLSGRLTLPESEADAQAIPISLKQILTSRVDTASDEARSVLHVLAVGAKPMRLGDLGVILQLPLDRAADAAEELQTRQLVQLDRDRLWIAHDLFRTATYRGLSEAHRAVLHHRVAMHILAKGGEASAGELAAHFDQAGRGELSAKYGWTAAGRAFERGAVAEAAHFYELVTRNESDQARRADATARLATSLHLNRNMSRANPALELASRRLRAAGMIVDARRIDIRRVEGLAEVGDTPVDELVERLASIKDECREAEDWEGVALALDTELRRLQLAERLGDVHRLCREFRTVLSREDNRAAAIAHRGLALALMLDSPVEALASATEAVERTIDLGADLRLAAMNRLLIVLLQQGIVRRSRYEKVLDEGQELANKSGDLLQRFSFESNLGVSFMDAGDLDKAESHFDRASALLGNADMTVPRINLALNRGELAIARKDFDVAAEHFLSADEYRGLAIPNYTQRLVHAGIGLCDLETGKVAEARRRFELLQDPPETWYYDPTTELQFRATFHERRARAEDAIDVLQEAQKDLAGRLVAAWVKTQLMLVKALRKVDGMESQKAALEGLDTTQRLGMRLREAEFRSFLAVEWSQ